MAQLDMFSGDEMSVIHKEIDGGEYILINNFFSPEKSKYFLEQLLSQIEWSQEYIKMYGKEFPVPRLSAWYGERNMTYTYSGITHKAKAWNGVLLEIKKKIEELYDYNFTSVLLNLYRNGNDSVSWHADDEKELGQNPEIVSLSFGATRKFQLRHNRTKERIDIGLKSGSLLIMKGSMQHNWQHQVPKTKKDVGARVNLTFRRIFNDK